MKRLAKQSNLINTRNSVIMAASAVAAAASAWDLTHRRVQRADLTESQMRVERLSDLRGEKHMLAEIEAGLRKEWGPYALLGFENIDAMASEAGRTIFVVVERDADGAKARGIVQTTLADVHGDPHLLAEAYPSFEALTSHDAWKNARHHGGDTAILLQITTLGASERGGGLGSLLRNAVLNMLGDGVRYALTTTPVDGTTRNTIDVEDHATFTPAMRFHQRGGANPTRILPDYKVPANGESTLAHGRDIVVMRYERDESGAWPAKRPPMRLRRVGPLEERILRTGRSIKVRSLRRGNVRLPSLRRPSLHRPHVSMPKLTLTRVRRRPVEGPKADATQAGS
ncbi:MAG TPA: hypothetical protein VFY10_08670 [Dehalococcoidia bacterium]|nr:hypothetical protein [Dehalococcoidia bacterium]